MALCDCRRVALAGLLVALALYFPFAAGIRTDNAAEDGQTMVEARAGLMAAIQNRAQDVLEASREFSEVALSTANDVYKPIMTKAGLPKHALLVAGSGGRYEMSTFSDIEYIVAFSASADVCNKKGEKQMLSLEKKLSQFRVALKKEGLESDRLNQPSVRKGSIACSPDKLVSSLLMSGDEVTTSMLLESTFLAGEESVAAEVRQAVKRWMETPKETAVKKGEAKISKKREILARQEAVTLGDWVRWKLVQWKYGPKIERARQTVLDGFDEFDIKATLYRPLQTVLFMEALGAPTEKMSAFNAVEKLGYIKQVGKMDKALHDQVKDALSTAVRVRMLSHAQSGKEQDMACLDCSGAMGFTGFHVPEDLKEAVLKSASIVGCVLQAVSLDNKLPKRC